MLPETPAAGNPGAGRGGLLDWRSSALQRPRRSAVVDPAVGFRLKAAR
jgi:hypothetical protein